jgi:tRNA(Ile)-lysidine synthase
MDLVTKVEQQIRAERLLEAKDCIVVAVSGGPDSAALLHILFLLSETWHWSLVVAHVNHQFRMEESAREAEFVRTLSESYGLPCEVGVINVPAYIAETGANPQAAAREKRYAFLHAVAQTYHANRIALAHHADDQAETVLMRLLRGTGVSGLSGIPVRRREKNVELVRPLLRIYKSELLAYCAEHGLEYCEDSSNRETKYVRNQIRLHVMPFLARFNSQLPQSLNRLSTIISSEDEYMETETELLFKRHVTHTEGGYSFSRQWFGTLHIALQRRLIKLILSYLANRPVEVDFSRVEQVRESILQSGRSNVRMMVSGRIFLTTEYDTALLHTMVLPQGKYAYQVDLGTEMIDILEANVRITCEWLDNGRSALRLGRNPAGDELLLDQDQVAFPLVVRSRIEGDRISVLGLNGSKKVKDIFIDDKVPPSQRDLIPILADATGRILWIAGLRRSKHALVTEKTRRILYMKLLHLEKD